MVRSDEETTRQVEKVTAAGNQFAKDINSHLTTALDQMKGQTRAMEVAAAASLKNAEAAEKSARNAEKAFEISQRADVSFHGTTAPVFEAGKIPEVTISILNTGHTPATVFELATGYFVGFQVELPQTPDGFRTATSKERFRITPGTAGVRGIRKTFKLANFHSSMPKGVVELLQNGKAHFWFYIKCLYKDHFGTRPSCQLFKYESGKLLLDLESAYQCTE
jgi:hypothetical protein